MAARNEDVLRGRGLMLDRPQLAFYLRVDDGLTMAGGPKCGLTASRTMRHPAGAPVAAGIAEDDRAEADAITKAPGYAPQASPAQLRLPPQRARELAQHLEQLAQQKRVRTEEVRHLLGAWI